MRAVGVILAGGQGRRMRGGARLGAEGDVACEGGENGKSGLGLGKGGSTDKALLPLGGAPLARRAAARLSAQLTPCAISYNGDPAALADLSLPVLPDPDGARAAGPLAGILSGLIWSHSIGAAGLVSAAVDTPFFPETLAAELAESGSLAIAATQEGAHPTFGYWPCDLIAPLQTYLAQGHRRMMGFAQDHGARQVIFPSDAAFFNINRPDDLARAEAHLAGAPL